MLHDYHHHHPLNIRVHKWMLKPRPVLNRVDSRVPSLMLSIHIFLNLPRLPFYYAVQQLL